MGWEGGGGPPSKYFAALIISSTVAVQLCSLTDQRLLLDFSCLFVLAFALALDAIASIFDAFLVFLVSAGYFEPAAQLC